jgi:hypothetical protein
MANDAGINLEELEQAIADAPDAETKRYLERVRDHRTNVRLANVNSYEIVAGNPEAYPARTVEQQEDVAQGRPNEPVSPEDTSIRGNEPAATDEKPVKASGNRNAK